MKTKTLLCSLVGLVTSVTLTGFIVIDRTQAQTMAIAEGYTKQPSLLAQAVTPKEPQRHHSQGSPSPAPMGMGMMNQQQADQHFIQMMIPHHQGAIDMANLALTKATRPELKQLAEAIKTSQSQEIQEMKVWYKQWYGKEVPAASGMMNMPMMGMPMQSGSGKNQGMPMNSGQGKDMMSMDLTALKNAKNFDQVFIAEMIPHHQMAVMMSAKVLTSPHPELRNLGKAVIQAQTTEIEEMFQWQQAWKQ